MRTTLSTSHAASPHKQQRGQPLKECWTGMHTDLHREHHAERAWPLLCCCAAHHAMGCMRLERTLVKWRL